MKYVYGHAVYEVGDQTDVCLCGCCGKYFDAEVSYPALFVGRICPDCETRIKRNRPKPPKPSALLRYERDVRSGKIDRPFEMKIKICGRVYTTPLALTEAGSLTRSELERVGA